MQCVKYTNFDDTDLSCTCTIYNFLHFPATSIHYVHVHDPHSVNIVGYWGILPQGPHLLKWPVAATAIKYNIPEIVHIIYMHSCGRI